MTENADPADRAVAVSVGDVTGGGDRMYLLGDLAFRFGAVLTIIVVAGLVAGHRRRARH